MRWDRVYIVIVSLLLVGLIVHWTWDTYSVVKPYSNEKVNKYIKIIKLYRRTHHPEEGIFNCANYSDFAFETAEIMGIETYKIVGCPLDKDKQCHGWIRLTLDFEPQTGKFVNYDKEYPTYRSVDD